MYTIPIEEYCGSAVRLSEEVTNAPIAPFVMTGKLEGKAASARR